jgi:hypothetical protein
VHSKKLKCFYFNFINYSVHTIVQPATMTTATPPTPATETFFGISRMEDAEPVVPFTAAASAADNGGSTPRPGTGTTEQEDIQAHHHHLQRKEWRAKIEISTQMEAQKIKRRRLLKTTTYYCPSTHPSVKKALALLGTKFENDAADDTTTPELITQSEFKLLQHAMSRHRIRLEVSDVTDLEQLRADLAETRMQTSVTETATIAAFALAVSKAIPDATAAGIEPEKIARLDSDYLSALQEFNENKYWVDALSREITRCSAPPLRRLAHPISPTQHARIAPSSSSILTNILTPKTCKQKFISLELLTKQIGAEFADFLSNPGRRVDRKRVAEQIADSLAARDQARARAS